MPRHPQLLLTSLVLALGLVAPAAASPLESSPVGSASDVVQRTAEDVLAVLRDSAASVEERRQRILDIAYDRFDFETIPRLVLARHWRRMTEAQREEFVNEFKRHLVVNYGDRIDRYGQEGVEILGERPEAGGDVTVRTRVSGGTVDDASVDYRLRQRDGRWYVIDVVVEGVSVLKSYRSQFREILNRGGPELLLKRLREKNEAGESGSADLDTSAT